MLFRENVGYVLICNIVGQIVGYFMGNVVFLVFSFVDFSNKYLRIQLLDDGVVIFLGFFYFWGIVFLVIIILVGLFKCEKFEIEFYGEEFVEGIVDGYKILMKILRCLSILRFMVILFTFKVKVKISCLIYKI